MKILFLLGAASRIRNFEHTIRLLAEHGHTLQLAGRPRKGKLELPKTLKSDRVTIRENPTDRGDGWQAVADALRGARDYVRYLDPRYALATRLVRRAYEISPTGFVLYCEQHPWLKRRWRVLSSLLAYGETLIPSARSFEAFIQDEQPDLVLVTPLVTFESYQTDYVKAAHRLGIPIAFLPFSWDNLTNKGLMRILPDRVIVWNEVQKTEAVELHGIAGDRVSVVGAARFDDFFTKTPSVGREEFFGQYGLDPTRPMILYLGSSQLTGPNEMELVRRWAESLRQADDPVLRSCGILVRPHPALKSSWVNVDLSEFGNVGLSLHARRSADQELFDSLSHAHAAVGLNTSAMLEAAIVGRPVHTLIIPGFDEGQIGTIHFRYLVEAFGGLVTVAHSFPEHLAQLREVLSGEPQQTERSRRFAEQFLRPHGIAQPVAPLLADAIERAADVRKRPQSFTAPWHYPLRWALKRWMRRPPAGRWDRLADDTSPVATSMSLRPVRTALEELHRESSPIFVGPWLGDITKELLLWIPFVRWATRAYGLSPDRLIVISCDGAREWYGPMGCRFLRARDLFSGAEFDDWSRRTIPQSQQNPKQAVLYPFDQEILQRAAAVMDASEPHCLHPQMLFRVLQRLDADGERARIHEVLVFERFDASGRIEVSPPLPAEFVAVSGPGAAAGRLGRLIERMTPGYPLVALDDAAVRLLGDRQHSMAGGLPASSTESLAPLAVQTEVLSRARAFVGPFGDLAVLAAFCGAPAYCVESGVDAPYADLLRSATEQAGWGHLSVLTADDIRGFRLPLKAMA